ncbi:MAG: hypothetical protein DSY50_06565 [Desulfobulbus sp.]|nr:MAG: hypothetical protein DSY50_06565 [Desulfobulbus sp.]
MKRTGFTGTTSPGSSGRERWFEQRRDFFMRQVFEDFFAIIRSFQELYQMYIGSTTPESSHGFNLQDRENNELRCRIWDRLTILVGTEVDKGPLWQLKDLCHRLWPDDEGAVSLEGTLIDWLVGLIFHEAMKLKENVYILGSYGPAALKRCNPATGERLGLQDFAQIMDVTELIRRVVVDVTAQMDQLAFLFGQTSYILRTMLPGLSENMLVVRLLTEQEKLVEELWGEGVVEVLADMFHGSPEQGFCAAGRSYLQGQWYDRARGMYKRALMIDENCQEAGLRIKELQGMADRNNEPADTG